MKQTALAFIFAGGPDGETASQRKPIPAKIRKRRTAVFEVVGESMIGDGIQPGSHVTILLSTFALPGAIVAALTPWGLCLKRFHPNPDGTISLVSSNPKFKPLIWEACDVTLVGIVKKVK